jgi:tetratricopeptide (TPR) repeat protein
VKVNPMNKDNVLFAITGLLLGFIIGFMFANSANQRAIAGPAAQMTQNATLPPNHPPITPGEGGGGDQSPAMADVQMAIKLAKDQPGNFDAQMKAAESYYQIQRFDEAIEYLKRANQIKPDAVETMVNLGNVYFDSGLYEDAERWYAAALKIKPDDVNARTDLGLTFFFRTPPDIDRAIKEYSTSLQQDPDHIQTLQNLTVALIKKGDAAQAQATLNKLEGVSPQNPALSKLRSDLDALRSAGNSQATSKSSVTVK